MASNVNVPLTAEQLRCIEENRQRALKIRAAKLAQAQQTAAQPVAFAANSGKPTGQGNAVNSFTPTEANVPSNRTWQGGFSGQNNQASAQGRVFQNNAPPAGAARPSVFQKPFSKNNNWNQATPQPQTSKAAIHLVLISESRFEVQAKFDPALNEVLKQLPTRQYDAAHKRWNFALSAYRECVTALSKLSHLSFEPLPNAVCAAFQEFINGNKPKEKGSNQTEQPTNPRSSSIELELELELNLPDSKSAETTTATQPDQLSGRIGDKLFSSLMPFQREGVEFAIRRNGRVLIGDDMGLGKTIQAIAVAAYYREDWPVLVLAPSSVRFQWQSQIAKWLNLSSNCDIIVINGSKEFLEYIRYSDGRGKSKTVQLKTKRRKKKDDLDVEDDIIRDDAETEVVETPQTADAASFVIMSYDLLSKHERQLISLAFKVVICDESHHLKNSQAARTQSALKVLRVARRVILLSGTPAMSRPEELYTQISAVDPNLFKSFAEYGRRYCAPRPTRWGWDYSGASNISELHALLRRCIMIRREKRDVLSQMPRKLREMIVLSDQLLDSDRRDATRRSYAAAMKRTKSGGEQRSALLEFFHETARMKQAAVCTYLTALIEKDVDRKMIVFAHHRELLDGIEQQVLVSKGVTYIRIDGSTSSSDRTAFCDTFQTRSDCHVALLSITAANCGLNLTACSLVIFAELHWNPGILIQAEDRAYRIGQSESVNVRYLVTLGTADDVVWPLIQAKLDVLSRAGLTSATRSDFRDCRTVKHDPRQRTLQGFTGKQASGKSFFGAAATPSAPVGKKSSNGKDQEVIEIDDDEVVEQDDETEVNAVAKALEAEPNCLDDDAFGEELFQAICTQML